MIHMSLVTYPLLFSPWPAHFESGLFTLAQQYQQYGYCSVFLLTLIIVFIDHNGPGVFSECVERNYVCLAC